MTAAVQPRQPLFVYPPLPKCEIRFYILVVTGCILYGWTSVIIASNQYAPHLANDFHERKQFPLIGPRYKDSSNWEWNRWSSFALRLLPFFALHSIIFNFSPRIFPANFLPFITTLYSVAYCCFLFTPWLVFLSIIQGLFIFAVSHYVGKTMAVWTSALPILYYVMNWTSHISEDPFYVLLFAAYTLLSYISYNLEVLRGEVRAEDNTLVKRFFRMLFYTFYPPYLISLIVNYPDFERQIAERETRVRNWRKTILQAAQVAFWWVLLENALYFCYHEIMLYDSQFSGSLPKDQFVPLGMAIGQFFQLKYMIIFGLPSVFARLDNMQPLKGPICIARVTLYSKIWRYFDRGLYAFFKKYIFIPICQPTFSIGRKLLGVVISYSFVLLWHGFHHHNIVWIGLNVVELFVEYGGKGIYSVEAVRMAREKHISDVAFRRILGWLQVVPFVFGLYSNFYFLGGSKVGYMFVQRIWNEETLTLQYPFWLLISLGYCYTHFTMEIERYLSERREQKKLHKE